MITPDTLQNEPWMSRTSLRQRDFSLLILKAESLFFMLFLQGSNKPYYTVHWIPCLEFSNT